MSSSVKTRKMTSVRGGENKKSGTHRSSPKLTKYLQNLGVSKTTDEEEVTPGPTENAMPTPTRNTQQKDRGNDQVCEQLYTEETDSEAEITSVHSEITTEDAFLKLPYDNIGELENECSEVVDPRSIMLSAETIPVILLSLIRQIESLQNNEAETENENKMIKEDMEKIETTHIEQSEEMKRLSKELIKTKTAQNVIEKENNELRASLDFAYNKITALENNEKDREQKEKKTQENMASLKSDTSKIKQDNTKMKEKTVKAEAYSRRSNLRFEGIPQSQNETNVQSRNKVYEILKNELGMNEAEGNIVIERCHRDAKFANQNPPSIIARFLSFNDRQEVWERRNKLNKNRNNNLYINEDFPQEVEKKRSFLRPYVKAAYKHDMKATLLGDILLVNGLKYTVDELDKLPEPLRPEHTVVKTEGGVTTFFRKDAFLSNFHPSNMTIDNENFSCVEQFYMAKKADTFGDKATKINIMNAQNPHEINFLGKNVKNFKQETWNERSYAIMKTAVTAKFSQNANLLKLLKNTGNTQIGEGSSKDLTWGTGVSVFHADAFNTQKWRGKNLLGKLLMEVRDTL